MAVTNLTGYTWIANNIVTPLQYGTERKRIFTDISISVTDGSRNKSGSWLYIGLTNDATYMVCPNVPATGNLTRFAYHYQAGWVYYYDWNDYYSSSQITINFISGSDLTDEDLIWWLKNNGTLTAPEPAGYEVTFVTNGGTSVTKLEDVEELPTPLPTTTKENNIFVGWYYNSALTNPAYSGDELTDDVTLYAKWYANMEDFYTDVADAIRSKTGETNPIKHTDFADKIEALPSPKEEQTKTVSPTTSSQDVLPDTNKVLSKVTVNAIPTETKSQQPNLLSGNQVINATSGNFMTSFTITKDTINHIASNIRSGKTLYGVTGSLQPAKEEETKTVTPNFASGNVVVTPTSGKVLSQVTINKDSNLIANNIKKDVTVHGITGSSFIAIELTQAEYDALSVYDDNIYYLIVEE